MREYFVIMNINIEHIIENVKNGTYNHEIVTEKFPEFFDNYPVFAQKIFEPTFDWELLNTLIKSKNKVESDEHTLHTASEEFGGVLVDKFVKPMLDKK